MNFIESYNDINNEMLGEVNYYYCESLILEASGKDSAEKKEGILRKIVNAIGNALQKLKDFLFKKSISKEDIPKSAENVEIETDIDLKKATKEIENQLVTSQENLKKINLELKKPFTPEVKSQAAFIHTKGLNKHSSKKSDDKVISVHLNPPTKDDMKKTAREVKYLRKEIKRQERMEKVAVAMGKAAVFSTITVGGGFFLLKKFNKYVDTLDKEQSALRRIVNCVKTGNPDAIEAATDEATVVSKLTAACNQIVAEINLKIKKAIVEAAKSAAEGVVTVTKKAKDEAVEKVHEVKDETLNKIRNNDTVKKVKKSTSEIASATADTLADPDIVKNLGKGLKTLTKPDTLRTVAKNTKDGLKIIGDAISSKTRDGKK